MGSKVRAKWKQKMMKDKGAIPKNKQLVQHPSTSARKTDKLLKQAEALVETFDYELARECCRKALRFEGTNIKAIEMLANISLDLGDPETAYDMLMEAVRLSPEVGHAKYFSLGQLTEGQTSLQYYSKGIDVATKSLQAEATAKSEQDSNIQREISNSYCAMAELYMTDLCFEEDAENQCRIMIDKAIAADPSSPDSLQCLANFQLTTGALEDAKKSMQSSLALWLPKYQALREGQLETTDLAQDCPLSYDSRLNTSKLLIELEMFDEVVDVLDGLVDEDDEVVDTWYLLGWSNYLRGEEYRGNARFFLTKAKEVAVKLKETKNEQHEHVEELLKELGPEPEDDDDDDKENESQNGEEDSDDDDEEMEQT